MKERNVIAIAAMLAFAGALSLPATWAQQRQTQDAGRRARIAAQLDKALPKWDATLLRAPSGEDWATEQDFPRLAKLFGEKLPDMREVPANARQLPTRDGVLRFDRGRGELRYVNRARAWQFDKLKSQPAVPEGEALKRTQEVARQLRLPQVEFAAPRVDTQVAAGAKAGARDIEERFEMYRLVTIERSVNGVPVLGSRLRTAINHDREVQRLQLRWPKFQLEPNLTMLSRKQVVDRAVERIVTQSADPSAKITAQLVYAPREGDEESRVFTPAVVISVYDLPTPYQVVVPVADQRRLGQEEEKG